IDEAVDNNFKLASQNLNNINILPQIGANVYDIIRHDNLFITEAAIQKLEERLC
ncbi:MAG: 50S ribosomal protein L4, partial [Pseudomonadota bacterium]